jgi:hypothetical protein
VGVSSGKYPPGLLDYRCEYHLRRLSPRHQGSHLPQRGLLLGKLTQSRLIRRITAYLPAGGTRAIT